MDASGSASPLLTPGTGGSAAEGYTLAVIGCGTMGVAILSGVLDSKTQVEARKNAMAAAASSQKQQQSNGGPDGPSLSDSIASLLDVDESSDPSSTRLLPSRFIACVSRTESARRLKRTFAAHADVVEVVASANVEAAQQADVVLLACKPQMVAEILVKEKGMREALHGKLVCSICAGLRIEQIRDMVDESTRVVRAMPNTPSKIRQGMTILTPLPSSDPLAAQSRRILVSIFQAVGRCRFLDEKHFDAATALAGSGPAFACVFLEAMADGAVMMGLPRKEALELAAQTMQGAARMVLESGMHPAAIKDSVTTPGGCTIAGLLNLEDGKVRSTVARTIQAAAEHASGLGQTSKK
ncbi:pyrroline-5-carboxylate reductase [Acaromyces ingoldii]|uniref:Pyrroline-5-carboxylate reductase n=1 Tax=Acaromyces ingoldii TaxID=215250 RepID=A0A316YF77_9BASI|nr:pyrroline-5-carboxylate reductase [Acaromyces ingoldii]PWN87524.1 pyrroline-5-carboxylate reductase [Acaromyces ingoldii]